MNLNYKNLTYLVYLLLSILSVVSCTPADHPEKMWTFSSTGLFSASLSPDGKYSLCATVDKGAVYWDLETNEEKFQFTHGIDPKTKQPKTVTQVALASGKAIGATALPGEMGIWDLDTGKSLRYWSLPYPDKQIASMSLSEFGKYALIGFSGGETLLLNLVSGQPLKEFYESDSVSTVALSHSGQFALIGSEDNQLKLWDLNSGTLAKKWTAESPVQYATFSPDDQFILMSQTLGKGKIFSVQTGEEISSLINEFGQDFSLGSNGLLSAIFFNQNKYIAAGCPPRYVRIFEVKTGKLIKQFHLANKADWITSPAPVIALATTPAHQLIAQSSNGLGYLYSLKGIKGL